MGRSVEKRSAPLFREGGQSPPAGGVDALGDLIRVRPDALEFCRSLADACSMGEPAVARDKKPSFVEIRLNSVW
ncbi:hypothetical protein DLS37_13950, partial [Staphylococcus pseudintermedius]